ncbi:hypothetical protein KP509_24G075000 [Ceratopteris richardii]|nr:hypothetical protein KP509_24G075000 [Ceratopteris richardii]
MLASYVCIRLHGHNVPQAGRRYANSRRVTLTGSNGEGEAQTTGLDEATLQSYPKIVFNEKHPPFPPQDSACSICLADYKDGEMLRFLPECRHTFHADCIDAWLRLHATCPMCRYSPLPTPQSTPGSTPLSDLIPMARYPLNIRYTIHHNV